MTDQVEQATEVVSEEDRPLFLAAYVAAATDDASNGPVGFGFHGYRVTDEVAKRGYGLKTTIPSPRGYIKGETADLKRVDCVIDCVWAETLPGEIANSVVGILLATTQLLELGLDYGVKSIWVGVPALRLSQAMASGMAAYRKANFKDKHGNVVPHKAQLEAFIRVFDLLAEKGIPVTIEHSSETDMGNILAGGNAALGLLNIKTGRKAEDLSVVDADGYWNYNHGRHPLLNHPRLLFVSTKSFSGLPEYLCTMDYEKSAMDKKDKHKLEIEVGQNLAHARYAVVKPHVVDPLLNAVALRHCQHHRTKHSNLSVMYLSAVFSKHGHAMLSRFGSDVLASKTHLTELMDGRGVMYTHDMPIPRKSLRSAQVYSKMEDALKGFEQAFDAGKESCFTYGCAFGEITATEITDLMISTTHNTKGKATHKPNALIELPNVTLDVQGKLLEGETLVSVPIKLTIGYDMPTRNTVAALLDDEFRAFVLVYRDTEVTVRHLTVMMSTKGIGIWTTPFAGRTFTLNKP